MPKAIEHLTSAVCNPDNQPTRRAILRGAALSTAAAAVVVVPAIAQADTDSMLALFAEWQRRHDDATAARARLNGIERPTFAATEKAAGAAWGRVFDIEETIQQTPASTWAGVACKLRVADSYDDEAVAAGLWRSAAHDAALLASAAGSAA
jgi:hypothetical protein